MDGNASDRIRLWPGVAAVALLWVVRFGVPLISPDAWAYGLLGSAAMALVVLVWWIFFSRISLGDRLFGLAMIAVGIVAMRPILHESIAGGMMGMMFPVYAVPAICLALVSWALVSGRLPSGARKPALAAVILAACAIFTSIRTDGIYGQTGSQMAWRWTKSHEEQLLAAKTELPAPETKPAPLVAEPKPVAEAAPVVRVKTPEPVSAAPVEQGPEWPGFRGAHRDSVVRGVRISTDWAASPPVEVWRRAVGPGWSSFAVHGGLVYTQEQRGESEMVTCYRLSNGEPVWAHRDAARFWESNGGAGPRGTPTVSGGRVYAFGATGILNALDAKSGALVWTRNVASDTGAKLPGWGFSSSPVVVEGTVIVAASGHLAAYDIARGELRWKLAAGGGSYGSPHVATIGGMTQVMLMSGEGAVGVAPADGSVLWKHAWEGAAILQPAFTDDGGVLIATGSQGGGEGTRRLAVSQSGNSWTAEARWTSQGLKPYFNDLVVHKGHAFGFDGSILSCIDLKDGARKWKGGRYGHGQMLLLADQDLLLVLSEEGEVALVGAATGQFTEIARFRAMNGKTWNHPAMAGNVLLVRNGEEMVALRLPGA
ncbi:MAG: PQQ-binding-like beta-propeller repeat protein [Bryobacteraceae bacterium]